MTVIDVEPDLPLWLRLTEPDTPAVNDLEAALQRLRKDGWTRGQLYDYQSGKCCALGALDGGYGPGARYLAYAVRNRKGGHQYRKDMSDLAVIVAFNDARGRRFEQVEATFLAAIGYASGKGVHVRSGS